MKDNETAITKRAAADVSINIESLMAQGIKNNLSVEGMERLYALRKEMKAEWAREQYFAALAKFQSECPVIEKTKEVFTKEGKLIYKYAGLDEIIHQVKGILEAHGFSYTIKTAQTAEDVTAICESHHAAGHQESTALTVPVNGGFMNKQQSIGAALSYAKRYAFCNAFGILTSDSDLDALDEKDDRRTDKRADVARCQAAYNNAPKEIVDEYLKKHGVKNIRELPEAAVNELIEYKKEAGEQAPPAAAGVAPAPAPAKEEAKPETEKPKATYKYIPNKIKQRWDVIKTDTGIETTYFVDKPLLNCTCASRKHPCKHIEGIKEYMKTKEYQDICAANNKDQAKIDSIDYAKYAMVLKEKGVEVTVETMVKEIFGWGLVVAFAFVRNLNGKKTDAELVKTDWEFAYKRLAGKITQEEFKKIAEAKP